MDKLTEKQRPIFLVFCLDLVFLWLVSLSLFWRLVTEKTLLDKINCEKIGWLIFFTAVAAFFMAKFPFLRPKWEKNISAIRIVEFFAASCFIIAFCSLLIEAILMKLKFQLAFNGIIAMVSMSLVIFLIERIIKPAAKISERTKKKEAVHA